MVNTCDPIFGVTLHEDNCLNRTLEDPFNISSVQPVIDSSTKIIYANKFCAFCNGVNHTSLLLDFFQSSIRCLSFIDTFLTYPSTPLEVSLRDGTCFYSFLPKSFEFIHESQCFINAINKCNVSGLWDVYDQVTEEACESYDLQYTSIYSEHFANIHCFLCNIHFETQLISFCQISEFTSFIYGSFMAILGKGGEKTNLQLSDEGACPATQFRDPIKEECRTIICPGAMLSTESGCLPLLTTMKEIYWAINILWIIPVVNTIEIQNFTNMMVDFAIEHVNTHMYKKFTDVSQRRTYIFTNNNPGDVLWVFIETSFEHGRDANDDPAVQFIRDFRESQIDKTVYGINDMNIQMEGILIGSNVKRRVDSFTYEVYDRVLTLSYSYVSKTIADYYWYYQDDYFTARTTWNCELVGLEKNEYSLSMYDTLIITRNDLKLSSVEYVIDYDASRVLICIEDFLFQKHIDSIVNVSMATKLLTGLSFGSTLGSIFCILLVLIAGSFVRVERTIADTLRVCLCVCIIISQCLQLSARYANEYRQICKVMGVAAHFFQVNTAAWIFIIAFYYFYSANTLPKENSRCLSKNALFLSFLTAALVPGVFVAINISISMMVLEPAGLGYGGKYCDVSSMSLLAFLSFLPTVIPLLSALFLLKLTHYTSKQISMSKENEEAKFNRNVYFVFTAILMFYWVLKFLSVVYDREDFAHMAMVFNFAKGAWLFRSYVPTGKILQIITKLVCYKD